MDHHPWMDPFAGRTLPPASHRRRVGGVCHRAPEITKLTLIELSGRPNQTPEAEARVGTSFRQLWGTGTGPQQQGSSWTCGEERNALRPCPVPEGGTHPGLRQPPTPPSWRPKEVPTLASASHRRLRLGDRRRYPPLASASHRRLSLGDRRRYPLWPPSAATVATVSVLRPSNFNKRYSACDPSHRPT